MAAQKSRTVPSPPSTQIFGPSMPFRVPVSSIEGFGGTRARGPRLPELWGVQKRQRAGFRDRDLPLTGTLEVEGKDKPHIKPASKVKFGSFQESVARIQIQTPNDRALIPRIPQKNLQIYRKSHTSAGSRSRQKHRSCAGKPTFVGAGLSISALRLLGSEVASCVGSTSS